jgi:hypothetical protein
LVSRETSGFVNKQGGTMNEELKQWEYRVQTIGTMFGTKDEKIEAMLNEWGNEGWEVTHHPKPAGSPVVSHMLRSAKQCRRRGEESGSYRTWL